MQARNKMNLSSQMYDNKFNDWSIVYYSRGGKRQIAPSTVKSMGNFLAPEP